MKKLITIFLLGVFISSGVLFAYSNPQLEKGLDTLGIMMEKKFSKQEQLQRYTAVQHAFTSMLKKKKGKEKKDFQLIVTWVEKKLSDLSHAGGENILSKKISPKNISKTETKIDTQTETKTLSLLTEQQKNLPNVDIKEIQKTWMQWHNEVRKKQGLSKYVLHDQLNYSAFIWAKHLSTLGTWSHKRKSTDGFYNYASIKEWFDNLGVKFSGKGTLFTESIALGSFSCKKSNCTNDLLRGMKKNFNFFMSEAKYKERRKKAHYRAIVHSYFNTMGVGVYQKNGRYYLVAHYGRNVK
ncbi:MAG: hypothetical protein CR971_01890 [candidate division SR1 bacterium]|nr:MAG: hypothetical protein CR971_01890 [candidate division SR1 bacterium]